MPGRETGHDALAHQLAANFISLMASKSCTPPFICVESLKRDVAACADQTPDDGTDGTQHRAVGGAAGDGENKNSYGICVSKSEERRAGQAAVKAELG